MRERYLLDCIQADLKRKMVFLGGPRQVGKTTLSKVILGKRQGYLNWDAPEDRELILKRELPQSDLWIFDELHKYRSWRNYLKGLYDKRAASQKILVTGSARLDYYRFGGESLQGRYHYLRLHPLSVAELGIKSAHELGDLMRLGGFPEPFFSGSETQAKRWSKEYRSRLVRDEIATLEAIRDLGTIELLLLRLPALVGAPLSINALREDLQRDHKTVAKWLDALERTYAIFRLPPFGAPKIRAVKKEQKHYHMDWTLVSDASLRFENLVACHLLKWVHFREDTEGASVELRYFRDVDRREVDFVIVEDGRPTHFIECRLNEAPVSASLHYLKARFPSVSAWQISSAGKKDFQTPEGIRVAPALKLLETLA